MKKKEVIVIKHCGFGSVYYYLKGNSKDRRRRARLLKRCNPTLHIESCYSNTNVMQRIKAKD
jgi:hypothetical protein